MIDYTIFVGDEPGYFHVAINHCGKLLASTHHRIITLLETPHDCNGRSVWKDECRRGRGASCNSKGPIAAFSARSQLHGNLGAVHSKDVIHLESECATTAKHLRLLHSHDFCARR